MIIFIVFLTGIGAFKGDIRLESDMVFYRQLSLYKYFRRPQGTFEIFADNPCKNVNKDCSTGTILDIYSTSGCNSIQQTNFYTMFPYYGEI